MFGFPSPPAAEEAEARERVHGSLDRILKLLHLAEQGPESSATPQPCLQDHTLFLDLRRPVFETIIINLGCSWCLHSASLLTPIHSLIWEGSLLGFACLISHLAGFWCKQLVLKHEQSPPLRMPFTLPGELPAWLWQSRNPNKGLLAYASCPG